jgi:hypothetical protein
MRNPTKDDFDRLFEPLGKEGGDKSVTEAITTLYREAKKSERVSASAVGLTPLLMSAVTASGVNAAPIVKVLMLGFHLGQMFADEHPSPGIPDDQFAQFMKSLDADMEGHE